MGVLEHPEHPPWVCPCPALPDTIHIVVETTYSSSGWLRHGALACIVTKQPNMLIQMIALQVTVMMHYNYTSTLLYIEKSLLIT